MVNWWGPKRQMMMRQITFLGAATIALAATMPAAAQDNNVGKRVERLEKEMRAVQRSVFPGGTPTFFEGEIAPDNTPGERARSDAPVIDLTARVDALESQLQTLTGQTEQNAFHLRELEKQFTAYKTEMDKRFADPAAARSFSQWARLPRSTPRCGAARQLCQRYRARVEARVPHTSFG